MVPAGRWSRLQGTTPTGGSDKSRPHLIPTTDWGCRLVSIDAAGFIGHTGLCPGEVTLDDGSTTLAYRFIALPEDQAQDLIDQLDTMIDNLRTQD